MIKKYQNSQTIFYCNMKKISVYTSSGRVAATANYRFYQYIDPLKYNVKFRKKISDKMYTERMPISKASFLIKAWCWVVLYLRGLYFLISDFFRKPDLLIISRGMLPVFFPLSYSFLLSRILKKTELIWDFDDNILEANEISETKFDWFSEKAKFITVASEYNKKMIKPQWRNKCIIIPTTDGDLYLHYNKELLESRIMSYQHTIRLLWVGSASGLEHLMSITSHIEEFAEIMKIEGKEVILTVVCNRPLNYLPHYFTNNYVRWTPKNTLEEMKRSHIGLMPLKETEFTKGKGGFKLIQYLSIGLPVIGSAVGINQDIIKNDSGFKVKDINSHDWVQALLKLSLSHDLYSSMSTRAFDNWKANFSFEKNTSTWELILKQTLDKN